MRFLFILVFLISSALYGQKKTCDCERFITGSFYMFDPENNEKDTLFIIRTAKEQTEILGDDYNKTHRVIWLSPCKFILRDSNIRTRKKYHRTDVIVKIIETGYDYYIVKAWAPGGKKMIMTVYVYNP